MSSETGRQKLPAEYVRRLVSYDPETGLMTWKERPRSMFSSDISHRSWTTRFAGKAAFNNVDAHGYLRSKIDGVNYTGHRIAWLITYGEWPDEQIDHINHDRSDNRICNLRAVDNSENTRNRLISKNNVSGVNGVGFVKRTGKWRARISVGNKSVALGQFSCITAAMVARKAAEVSAGYHENHGGSL